MLGYQDERIPEGWLSFFVDGSETKDQANRNKPIQERVQEALKSHEIPHRAASNRLARNIRCLSATLGMSAGERRLLRLAVLRWLFEPLELALSVCGKVHQLDASRLLAAAIDSPSGLVFQSLEPSRSLRASGLLSTAQFPCRVPDLLRLPTGLAEDVIFNAKGAEAVLARLCRISAPAKLKRQDFPQAASEIDVIVAMLKSMDNLPRLGMNVLIYGTPGTGKTEFARMVSAEVGHQLLEVPCVDGDEDPLNAERRFLAYWTCQRIAAAQSRGMVLFDEAEDVFPPLPKGIGQTAADNARGPRKAWINSMLESNAVPTIWTSNSIHQIEDSILRRFDLVFELLPPGLRLRRAITDRYLGSLGISPEMLERLARTRTLVPAHVERLAAVLAPIQDSGEDASRACATAINHHLREFHGVACAMESTARFSGDVVPPVSDRSISRVAQDIVGSHARRIIVKGRSASDRRSWCDCLARHLDRDLSVISLLLYFHPNGPDHRHLARRLDRSLRADEIVLLDDVDLLESVAAGDQGFSLRLAARHVGDVIASYPGVLLIALPENPDALPVCVRERPSITVRLRALTPAVVWQALVGVARHHRLNMDISEVHARDILTKCAFESVDAARAAIGDVLAGSKPASVLGLLDELQRIREPSRINDRSRMGFLGIVGTS
jgi:hypothetical protein